jgi:hypothetical protein
LKPRWYTRQTPSGLAAARQRSASSPAIILEDEEWIGIFRAIHRLLSHLYCDKTHIEIMHYLVCVATNFNLAGYGGADEEIATHFRTLFPQLGFQAVKGRDARKFVYVQDVFGRQEPFALLKLEWEDG